MALDLEAANPAFLTGYRRRLGLGIAMGVLGDGRALVTTTAAAEALPIGLRPGREGLGNGGRRPWAILALPAKTTAPPPPVPCPTPRKAGPATPMPQETLLAPSPQPWAGLSDGGLSS